MLSLNNTLEKDNGSLREINRQLKAKYENGVVTLVAYEDTLISWESLGPGSELDHKSSQLS